MASSFFFYDLETSGISPGRDRIMQFAGQRTDMQLKPIGQAYNQLIKLSADILPQPGAILLTGILPDNCNKLGISEAQFSAIFNDQIATAETIFVGFNNLRFDDEFIRFLNYRNFYDPFKWHYGDGRSRWDLLDLVRMTRALRPDGLNWPFSDDGKPSNRLELLTRQNNLDHDFAHDALGDVMATIAVAKLLKSAQPKLFDFLLQLRAKDKVEALVRGAEPYVYTSSHYGSGCLHTTAVATLDIDSSKSTALVYDLRHNPSQFAKLKAGELAELWRYNPETRTTPLPIKTMKLNRCPAIAPLSVLDQGSLDRLKLDLAQINKNKQLFDEGKQRLSQQLETVLKLLDKEQDQKQKQWRSLGQFNVEQRLYDQFVPYADQYKFATVRAEAPVTASVPKFSDHRLPELYKLYRARNYPDSLSPEEQSWWRQLVHARLFEGKDGSSVWGVYLVELNRLKIEYKKDSRKSAILDSLEDYARLIANDYETDLPAEAV